ncbi:hypothetical protein FACS1894188_10220 [Clostridia bacterium]|nr:hypothetical protein FACS1894188_10220 [Clostridia bacterium]
MSDGINDGELNELIQRVTALGGNIENALKIGLLKAGAKVQADAKNNCPMTATGRLKNSIVTSYSNDTATRIHYIIVGTNVNYAPYVEYGTGPVGAASQKDAPPNMNLTYRSTPWVFKDEDTDKFIFTRGQPAKPFLYPAFKNNQNAVKNIIKEELRKALRSL